MSVRLPNGNLEPQPMIRVRVRSGFCSYLTRAETAEGKLPVPEHLPGAVIDLEQDLARYELHIKRVVEVDPATPLTEGYQPATGGTADEDARDAATLARATVDIVDLVNKAVAEALAKAKK